jgi:hypothetical protein
MFEMFLYAYYSSILTHNVSFIEKCDILTSIFNAKSRRIALSFGTLPFVYKDFKWDWSLRSSFLPMFHQTSIFL